ncbi:phage-related integrase [Bordetella hinzii]|uniref:tyrosine-type recombinase/integrase n=1 Tax=Bordetella hinzii TaxID=103855 RepID=UPI000405300C|nr:integrase arm-type DNA-binding domain-containing protein [Bordetella hinzii]AKQ56396.1 Putative prophage CPS-53 integrase [Bordetella hinzii]KCB28571.1 site-specific recombinase, phage integrase family [Bordetella hinzii L60]SNV74877.1 phage-related integrase [Bordetella hinzii]
MLTDAAIRSAKPGDKLQKLPDSDGLYLEITPTGSRGWRFRYRFDGKEKLISLGVYPTVSLKEARQRRDEARRMVANGIDPSAARKAHKAARAGRASNSFETVAREWFEVWKADKADGHADKIIARLEKDIFPWIGGTSVAEITAPMVLEVLRRIEKRGVIETAHRAKTNISQVMRYAIATGRAERDPCPDLRGALKIYRGTNFAAIIDPAELGELLRAIDAYKGGIGTRAALQLAPLVFVRPGELCGARWVDIDLDKAEWRYTTSKTGTEHLVPLARQAVSILTDLRQYTGGMEHVFPGQRSPKRPMTKEGLLAALRRMGYDKETMTIHGFRATARTLLAEQLHYPAEVIEHQLAHAVPDALGTSYNRTKFIKERREMMQAWADHLDKLKAGASISSISKTAA